MLHAVQQRVAQTACLLSLLTWRGSKALQHGVLQRRQMLPSKA